MKPLTTHIKTDGSPLSLEEYERLGGYQALRKALGMSPAEITAEVKDSNLKGRGGAGFNTGMKWSFVPMDENIDTKYLICNADEMEPGTFKDRWLLEGHPHQLLEGMLIAAYAIQATEGYVFLRWAYKTAAEGIRRAIAEAELSGYLGQNILGSGFHLKMHLHTGVGRYMCGEETALLNSLEGKRATPRAKPPFPQVSGLFGKPTIVNNVETFSCIPHIISMGADWFRNLSKNPQDGGTKIYGVSGQVKRPGAWELPMGVTLRELIEEHAGGMKDGFHFRGALPGGASTDFLVEEHLDVAMDYGSVAAAGSRLGTGTVVVLDDRTCPVGFVHNLEHFFAQESCGWCTPCREGLPWTEKILKALENGEGRENDLDTLAFHTKALGPGHTFCALAPGAMEPLQSALKYFRQDFEQHIHEKRCPYGHTIH
ncbi:NADH dehydrogenase subunit F [Anseongella ginsenosidimutans]|uniref:NADH-quinone oxidoreductase subunit F n=1 Tax=Anseongella ginsenosidimutans TaxID=496056 RepID=A0A4R3KSY0_9SPHI|nr:NADH-quinone oxidoreductase subunit NuoF [Anseongella ginsenosidimutans]QEC52283.1 NADH-quinone oxidoreductase subunit NuoF [Anseongella ginsenosidimutans]TCS86841.1 NADH dehydrogenase subunit F [Anseongella ginsenosidimutans]